MTSTGSAGARFTPRPKRAWRFSSSSRPGTTENAVTQPWATSAPRSSNGPRRRAPHVQRRPPIITTKLSDSARCGSTIWRSTAAFRSCLTHRSRERLHHHRRSLTSVLVTKAQMCPRDRGNSREKIARWRVCISSHRSPHRRDSPWWPSWDVRLRTPVACPFVPRASPPNRPPRCGNDKSLLGGVAAQVERRHPHGRCAGIPEMDCASPRRR